LWFGCDLLPRHGLFTLSCAPAPPLVTRWLLHCSAQPPNMYCIASYRIAPHGITSLRIISAFAVRIVRLGSIQPQRQIPSVRFSALVQRVTHHLSQPLLRAAPRRIQRINTPARPSSTEWRFCVNRCRRVKFSSVFLRPSVFLPTRRWAFGVHLFASLRFASHRIASHRIASVSGTECKLWVSSSLAPLLRVCLLWW